MFSFHLLLFCIFFACRVFAHVIFPTQALFMFISNFLRVSCLHSHHIFEPSRIHLLFWIFACRVFAHVIFPTQSLFMFSFHLLFCIFFACRVSAHFISSPPMSLLCTSHASPLTLTPPTCPSPPAHRRRALPFTNTSPAAP